MDSCELSQRWSRRLSTRRTELLYMEKDADVEESVRIMLVVQGI